MRIVLNPAAYIRIDGTSTTTAQIPFAEGLKIPDDKNLVFGTGNDIAIDWVNASSYLSIAGGDLRITSTSELQFRDGDIFIYSNADGELTIQADTQLTLGVAGDIELGDGTLRKMYPNTEAKMDLGDTGHYFNRTYTRELFYSNYASITTTANSTAGNSMRNPFDEDNYSTYTSDAHVTARGITYTSTDGRFTVDDDGVYVITFTLNVLIASSDEMNIEIRDNGVAFYDEDTFVHSSVDPVMRGVTVIRDLTDGDYIEVYAGPADGVDNVIFHAGTTMSIHRIGNT